MLNQSKSGIKSAVIHFLIPAALASLLALTGFFTRLDRVLYDQALRFTITHNPLPLNPRIVRIDLNDSSERALEEAINDRSAFADLVTVLADCGADAAMDFVFRGKSAYDEKIAEAAKWIDSFVLAAVPVPLEYNNAAYNNMTEEEERIVEAGLWHIKEYGEGTIPRAAGFILSTGEIARSGQLGHIGVKNDDDGLYRRTPLFYRWKDGLVPSLALAMAASQLGIDPADIEFYPGKEVLLPADPPVHIPVDNSAYVMIPFTRPWADDLYRLSFAQAVSAASDEEVFEKLSAELPGALVLAADITTAKKDYGVTPFETLYPLSEIHASLLSGILDNYFYTPPAPAFQGVFLLASALVLIWFCSLKKDSLFHAGFLGLLFFQVLFIALVWRYMRIIPAFSGILFFVFIQWGFHFSRRLVARYREKFLLEMTFSRYLSPDVIRQLMADPSRLSLGGEEREMSALFTDIQGFSTIAEKLHDPRRIVELLNYYLGEMSGIILENRGTIDKYEGDAIIAFFGAPLASGTDPADACRTAVLMKRREILLNEEIARRNLSPSPLFTRIGINSGLMVVGNMGTEKKMDYTIMGNTVNLASRLEGINKQYHTGILISEETKKRAGGGFVLRSIDRVRAVGFDTPVRLYELLDILPDASPALLEMADAWEEAVHHYETGAFEKARDLFASLRARSPQDKTAAFYEERCAALLNNPPPPDWDGITNLTQK
ncbi:MAG: adenylate/guanylate cyclase domain-containing protein [Spirochaetales bacterium]|jgi:class 3 adenylate cyclase/CHASE2 domain-containing sensor protein|nr:adenylate/guanylate cyclase domain-containing protein [Spirochaetales bacterium]